MLQNASVNQHVSLRSCNITLSCHYHHHHHHHHHNQHDIPQRPQDARRVEKSEEDTERDTPVRGRDDSKQGMFVGRVFAKSIVGDIFSSNKTNASFSASLTYRSRIMDKADLTNLTHEQEVEADVVEDSLANTQDLIESDR